MAEIIEGTTVEVEKLKAEYEKQLLDLKNSLAEVEKNNKLKEMTDEREKEKYLFTLKEQEFTKKLQEAEAKLKVVEEEKKNVEFKNEIEKLKANNPDLLGAINKINSWDKLNMFLEIKPELDVQIKELTKFKELNKQGNSNAFKGVKETTSNINTNTIYEQKLKEAKERITKK